MFSRIESISGRARSTSAALVRRNSPEGCISWICASAGWLLAASATPMESSVVTCADVRFRSWRSPISAYTGGVGTHGSCGVVVAAGGGADEEQAASARMPSAVRSLFIVEVGEEFGIFPAAGRAIRAG